MIISIINLLIDSDKSGIKLERVFVHIHLNIAFFDKMGKEYYSIANEVLSCVLIVNQVSLVF